MNRYLALQKVVELGSFTKAAEELGYTQSSVSQMVASLEDELGMKLLIRSRTGVRLTLEGAELYPLIERTLFQYRAMRERADEIRGLETGVIRVGTISSVTCYWMPQLIAGFQESYPNVQFVFHQGDYSLIPEWIRSGQIDFGFINPDCADGLTLKKVKDGEMLAVLPEDHPLAKEERVPLAALAEENFILLEEGQGSEPLEAFSRIGASPRVRYTLHDDYAIMTMVEAGLGVSILAELILQRANYHIAVRPIDPPVIRTLSVVYRSWDSLPIASKRFIEYLLAHQDELP